VAAWQAVAIALAIGFLIGAERERDGGPAGIRTFALAGLAGAVAALVHPVALAAVVAGAALIVAAVVLRPVAVSEPGTSGPGTTGGPASGIGGWLQGQPRLGTASAVALVLTVALGGLTTVQPAVAAGAGVATAVMLLAKERLHHVIREKISELELSDALKFFVAAFIVLPLMPHANLGPYGVIDPRRLWTFVVAVTALGALGYVAVRLFGPERGLPAAGLAGGFVSGAATTGAMARSSRDPALFRPAMAAALLASVATLVQLVLVTWVASAEVAQLLLPAAALGAAVLVGEAGWLLLRPARTDTAAEPADRTDADRTDADPDDAPPGGDPGGRAVPVAQRSPVRRAGETIIIEGSTITAIDFGADQRPPEQPSPVDTEVDDEDALGNEPTRELPHVRRPKALVGRRPFDLGPALLLTAILAVFLVLSAMAEHLLGPGAAVTTITAAGLADSHAGALTAANLATQHTLTVRTAALAAMGALAANTVVKLILAHIAGGRRASTTLAALFAGPVVAVVVGLLITLGLN
jgi:uncharacterized membrane protein (DUF4010 family)